MHALTDRQLNQLQRMLAELQKGLRRQLEISGDGAKPVSLDEPIGRLSRMDAMQQQSMAQANRRTAQNRLARVEAALRRYDSDAYGLCVECAEEIGYARLLAQPEAPLCIDCQNNREARDA